MKYDDLEKTKELFEIDEDVPTPIENIEMEGISKDTVTDEFTLGLTDKEASIINKNIKEKEEKSSKKSKKEKGSYYIINCFNINSYYYFYLNVSIKKR